MPWMKADATGMELSPFLSGVLTDTDVEDLSLLESEIICFKVFDPDSFASRMDKERTFLIGVKDFQGMKRKDAEDSIVYQDGEWIIQGAFENIVLAEAPFVNISVNNLLLRIPVGEPYKEDEVVELEKEFDRIKEKHNLEEGMQYVVKATPFIQSVIDRDKDLFLERADSMSHRINIQEDAELTTETPTIYVEFVYNGLVVGRISDFLHYIPSMIRGLSETIRDGDTETLSSADQGANIEIVDYEGKYVKLKFQSSEYQTPQEGFWVRKSLMIQELADSLKSLEEELRSRDPEVVEKLKDEEIL